MGLDQFVDVDEVRQIAAESYVPVGRVDHGRVPRVGTILNVQEVGLVGEEIGPVQRTLRHGAGACGARGSPVEPLQIRESAVIIK